MWLTKISIPKEDCNYCIFHGGGHLCNSLDLLRVGLHTSCAEYYDAKCNLRVLDLVLFAVKHKTVIAGYLHQVEKDFIMLSF